MNFKDYQEKAQRTARSSLTCEQAVANFAMGLAGESGEAVDLLKKHLFHGHELDAARLKKELGDVLWYLTALASVYGWELEDIAAENIAKLLARYPDGFSSERSVNREVSHE